MLFGAAGGKKLLVASLPHDVLSIKSFKSSGAVDAEDRWYVGNMVLGAGLEPAQPKAEGF